MSPRYKEDKTYDTVMKLFGGRCVLCDTSFGVTVHEIVPKSLAPTTWSNVDNRVPLCAKHHEYVHTLSKRDREDLLYPARDRALKFRTQ